MHAMVTSQERRYRTTFWVWFALTLTTTVACYGGNRAFPEMLLAGALLGMSLLWSIRLVRTGGPAARGPRTLHMIAVGSLLWTAAFLVPLPADLAARLSAWSAWGQELNHEASQATGLAVSTTTATMSIDPAASAHTLRKLACYYVLLVLLTAHVPRWRDLRMMLTIIVAVAVAEAVVGSAGILTGSRRFLWLLPNPVNEAHRHFGTFVNANHAGTFLGVGLLLWIPLALVPAAIRTRQTAVKCSARRVIRVVVCALVPAVVVVGLVLTNSHGALAATMLPFLVVVLGFAVRHPSTRLPLLLAGTLTLGGGLAVYRVLPATERARLVNKLVDRGAWITGERPVFRRTIWSGAIAAAAVAPWCGSGPGTFIDAYRPFDLTRKETLINSAHNTYLDVLIEGGLVGVSLMALAIGWLACKSGGRPRASEGGVGPDGYGSRGACIRAMIRAGLGGAATVLLLHCIVDFPVQIPAIAILCVALVAGGSRSASGRKRSRTQGCGRLLVPIATVVASAILVISHVGPLLATIRLARAVSQQRMNEKHDDIGIVAPGDLLFGIVDSASALHSLRFQSSRGAAYGLRARTGASYESDADLQFNEDLLGDALEMLRTNPFCVEARVAAATAAAHRGDTRAALTLSHQAQRLDGGHAETHYAAGRALLAAGADRRAMAAFATSLNASPRFVFAIARDVQEHGLADELLTLRIDEPRSLCWLAMSLPHADAETKERVAADLVTRLDGGAEGLTRGEHLYLHGQIALWLEDEPEKAIGYFEQSLAIEPLVWIHWQLAQAYRRANRPADAQRQMNVIRQIDSNYTPPEESLRWATLPGRLGRDDP